MFNSRNQHKNLKSEDFYDHYLNYIFWPPLLVVLVNEKLKKIKWCGYFAIKEKIVQTSEGRGGGGGGGGGS